jgi:hypothetical protein
MSLPSHLSDCHPFQAAGLGLAPFRFVGVTENMWSPCPGVAAKPGGSCDYCSASIRYEFHIEGADGSHFKVGCDCVMKIRRADNMLVSAVEAAERKLKRAAAAERTKARQASDANPSIRERLAGEPHPLFKDGRTLADYVDWLRSNAGNSGRLRAAKFVNNAALTVGLGE